jgi:hypothetical protein
MKDEKNRKVLEQAESCKPIPKLALNLDTFLLKEEKKAKNRYI